MSRGSRPIYMGMGSGDAYGGIMSAMGIAMAIYQRNKTGRGQCLDASLYGAQLYLAAPYLQSFLAGNKQQCPAAVAQGGGECPVESVPDGRQVGLCL